MTDTSSSLCASGLKTTQCDNERQMYATVKRTLLLSSSFPANSQEQQPASTSDYIVSLPSIVSFNISYPAYWKPDKYFNNHSLYASTVADNSLAWIDAMNLIPKDARTAWMNRILQMNIRSYGGASLALGNYTHTLLHTKMVLLWLLWDDVIVEQVFPTKEQIDIQKMHFEAMKHIMHGRFDVSNVPETSSSSSTSIQKDHISVGECSNPQDLHIANIHDAFATAWKDIMKEICSLSYVTPDFLQRFGDCFEEWIDYAIQERDGTIVRDPVPALSQTIDNDHQNHNDHDGTIHHAAADRDYIFESFVVQRAKTIGMLNTAQVVELSCGFVLPQQIWNHRSFQLLLQYAAELVGLTNELVSLGKDIRHFQDAREVAISTEDSGSATTTTMSPSSSSAWTNLVLIYAELHQIDLRASIQRIIQLHDAAIVKFDAEANLLVEHLSAEQEELTDSSSLPLGNWKERLLGFIYNLRVCVYGFAYWHMTTERYIADIAIDTSRNEAYLFKFQ